MKKIIKLSIYSLILMTLFNINIKAESVPTIKYQTHIQNIGWQTEVSSNNIAGTTGLALRMEAIKVNKDIDLMAIGSEVYADVVKSVTVDIVARTLMTSTNQEPMSQFSQSALGYSVSGTFLTPGGGLFIKRDELKALGLRSQRVGVMEPYEY